MSKIYRRSNLVEHVKPVKIDKNRKRSVIMNFRVSPEEQQLINHRISQTGLSKADFFINSCLHQEIHVTGNIRTFDEMKRRMESIDSHLCNIEMTEELDMEILEQLRTILELLDNVYKDSEEE